MSITDKTTAEEILEQYGVGVTGIAEVLDIIVHATNLDLSADDLATGFKQSAEIVAALPEEIIAFAKQGPAFEVLETARLAVDLHEAALAAGKVSTVRSIGLAVAQVGIAVTRRDAASGNVEAQDALKQAGLS